MKANTIWAIAFGFLFCFAPLLIQADPHASREYNANRVPGAAPTIDGEYTEEEWAGSEWTTGFYGLNNQSSNGSNQANLIDLNYRWRALWDDDYLYILFEAETFDLPINGIVGEDIVNPIVQDDDTFSYAIGLGTDMEIFLEPNWQEGDGFNSDPPDFTDPGGDVNDGYHFVWFPLENDEDWTELNEGIRGADNIEGPPYFSSSGGYNNTYLGGTWDPTFDPAAAEAAGAMPFLGAGFLHHTGAERGSGEVYANPVMEVGIAFSQMNPTFGMAEMGNEGETHLTLEPDADGNYVHVGDQWLVNMAGYTDPYTAAEGLTLITWNNVIGGPFASYPRGIMTFVDESDVGDWMMH